MSRKIEQPSFKNLEQCGCRKTNLNWPLKEKKVIYESL